MPTQTAKIVKKVYSVSSTPSYNSFPWRTASMSSQYVRHSKTEYRSLDTHVPLPCNVGGIHRVVRLSLSPWILHGKRGSCEGRPWNA